MKPQDDDFQDDDFIEYEFEFIHYMTKYRDDGIDFKFYHDNYVEITDEIIEAAANNPKTNKDELNELKSLKGKCVPGQLHGQVIKEIDNDMLERLYQRMLKDTPRKEKYFINQQIKILKKFPKEIKDKFEHKYFALLQLFENKKIALKTKGATTPADKHQQVPEPGTAAAPQTAKDDPYQFIKDTLKPLSGNWWLNDMRIMTDKEYNSLVNNTVYLIEHKKLPTKFVMIARTGATTEFIRKTFHRLFEHTRKAIPRNLYCQFLQKAFGQFKDLELNSITQNFSRFEGGKYDEIVGVIISKLG